MSTAVEILHEIRSLPESERRTLFATLGVMKGDVLRRFKTRIGTSSATGLPMLVSETGAPQITGEDVRKILSDFP